MKPLPLLAPVFGLYNVRRGHSAVLLRTAKDQYRPDAFFHFYLPAQKAENGSGDRIDVPLNWVLSDSTKRFIQAAIDDKEIGNAAEAQRLAKALAH